MPQSCQPLIQQTKAAITSWHDYWWSKYLLDSGANKICDRALMRILTWCGCASTWTAIRCCRRRRRTSCSARSWRCRARRRWAVHLVVRTLSTIFYWIFMRWNYTTRQPALFIVNSSGKRLFFEDWLKVCASLRTWIVHTSACEVLDDECFLWKLSLRN